MKRLHLLLPLLLPLLPPLLLNLASFAAAEELLQFNTSALPACAYNCAPLYSAQYDCARTGGDGARVDCFCKSALVKGQRCERVCGFAEQRRVVAWVRGRCGEEVMTVDKGKGEGGAEGAGKKDAAGDKDKDTDTDTAGDINTMSTDNNAPSTAEKQASWSVRSLPPSCAHPLTTPRWRKNYPYFLLAFILTTVPPALFAASIPLRRHLRQRRRALSMPPYVPPAVVQIDTPYSYGGGGSYGSSAGRSGGGGSSVGMARSEADSMRPVVPSTRQESWERRLRESFENREGRKRGFWGWMTTRRAEYGAVRQTQG
ncbi:hypothetical protein EDC01DRAFT_631124 [Geopyxis carbonaria]|nr:hypothetical protein EDC01DRAFT_631124 [Geopyxis carbonaria]